MTKLLTKQEWIDLLWGPITHPTEGWQLIAGGVCTWLGAGLEAHTPMVDLDMPLSVQQLIEAIELIERADQGRHAADSCVGFVQGNVYAPSNAERLVEIAEIFVGEEFADELRVYLHADLNEINAALRDFLREVYQPFYPFFADASGSSEAWLCDGRVKVIFNPLMAGRGHVFVSMGDTQLSLLGDGGEDPTGDTFNLNHVRSSSAGEVVKMLGMAGGGMPTDRLEIEALLEPSRLYVGPFGA